VSEFIAPIIASINEVLAAAIVIIAASMLLYNITRNLNNRVARSSGIVLSCVTFAYLCDVFLSLGPAEPATEAIVLRLQWIGIAFIPAALFHLSDALLATTGLPSRGRRRRVVRVLYVISGLFLLMAGFSDDLIDTVIQGDFVYLAGGPVFLVYLAYFLVACGVTFYNVQRARKRCLTTGSERRMAYLQATILTPALGIFPYSVIIGATPDISLLIQVLVNVANVVVVIMLVFLSYPLSFFGSDVPDRVVKVELLRFLLRGPGTGVVALSVIIFTRRAEEILSLPATDFMPLAVVAAVLVWQWSISLALPYMEQFLVYGDEDDEQLAKLQDLSDRLLTRGDLQQLIHATLEALCEYLRSGVAFVVSLPNGNRRIELIETIGDFPYTEDALRDERDTLRDLGDDAGRVAGRSAFQTWQEVYQIVPLYSKRIPVSVNGGDEDNDTPVTGLTLIGIMGVRITEEQLQLDDDEDAEVIYTFVQRAEQTLDDLLLQGEIYAALEGLLPQIRMTRSRADEVEYRPGRSGRPQKRELPTRDETYELVRAALRHYWGGPGMTRSRLMDLKVVQQEMESTDTPVHALRNVLQEAIERQKPDGERTMTDVEWTMYNILDLRFLERKKVKNVARRMSMSESDLYRKQRLAIEAVADTILEMEKETLNSQDLL
jgi:hypothetical protein